MKLIVTGREVCDGWGIWRKAPPGRVQRARSQLVCAYTSDAAAGWKRGSCAPARRRCAGGKTDGERAGASQRKLKDMDMEDLPKST